LLVPWKFIGKNKHILDKGRFKIDANINKTHKSIYRGILLMRGKLKKLFKEKKKLTIGIFSMFALILIIFSAYLFARHTYNKDILIEKPIEVEDKTPTPESSTEPEKVEVDYGVESDIVDVLLVGVDSRGEFSDSRTDSIIIASIDPTSKKVKLTSFMRDMYVEIPGKGYNKINAAFELGGVELLKKTIKYNFGFNVDNYVAIDFQGFQGLIDTLDGVELDVKDYEVKEVNKYIQEVNGSNSTLLQSSGMQKLNGQQALSYCRIRKVGNNDYERTERQRMVLSLLLSKVKDTSVLSYPKLYSTISSYVKTNIPFEAMLKIVYTVYKFGAISTDSFRLPIDGHFKDTNISSQSVLIPELKYNATQFYKFIYNTVPVKLKVPDNSKVYNQDLNNKNIGSTEQKPNQTPNQPPRAGTDQTQQPSQNPTQANTPPTTQDGNTTPTTPPSTTDGNTTPTTPPSTTDGNTGTTTESSGTQPSVNTSAGQGTQAGSNH
jgi:polyisoprenyl-teichoic acid--peptidoglycan teichoic acid transferase